MFLNESHKPNWDKDGRDWPHRDFSRFVTAAGLSWHVQVMGQGPGLVLIHGTAASTHSWRGLAPLLAEYFTTVAVDLPGHGFTESPPTFRLSIEGMASDLGRLLDELDVDAQVGVGHSAGASILVRMCLEEQLKAKTILSLNGALMPFPGHASWLSPVIAKILFLNPIAPRFFAFRASDHSLVQSLIRRTGSEIEPEGYDMYARLFRHPGHVAGALGMMANWDLIGLKRDLPNLATPLTLVVGSNDNSISPHNAKLVQRLVPGASIETVTGLGHLAHEEDPEKICAIIVKTARECGVLSSDQA